MQDHDGRDRVRTALAELFSGYRAEWLADSVFSLFREPTYFPQLVTPHPCFLVGGRGTGKTTALRCLSYEGLTRSLASLKGGDQTTSEITMADRRRDARRPAAHLLQRALR